MKQTILTIFIISCLSAFSQKDDADSTLSTLKTSEYPLEHHKDTMRFNLQNIPWIVIKSSNVDSISNVLSKLYVIHDSWKMRSAAEYKCIWYSQIAVVKLNSNWTFVGGWGLINLLEDQIVEIQEICNGLAQKFEEVHFYLDQADYRYGWLIYKNGAPFSKYIFEYDYDWNIETIAGPDSLRKEILDSLNADVMPEQLLGAQFHKLAPGLESYFKWFSNHYTMYFEKVITPNDGKILITYEGTRDPCFELRD